MKKNILLSLCSAGLLILSFPTFHLSFLIWFALIPLFILLDGKGLKSAFFWGWFVGFLFFLGTHYWLIHVTLPGMVLVNIYLGIYFGLFALGYSLFQKFSLRNKLWIIPCLWVVAEFGRDRLLTGFGWACLGHSQYQVLPLIQVADITGVFGVSFVIVMVNVVLKDVIKNVGSGSPIGAFGDDKKIVFGDDKKKVFGDDKKIVFGDDKKIVFGDDKKIVFGDDKKIVFGDDRRGRKIGNVPAFLKGQARHAIVCVLIVIVAVLCYGFWRLSQFSPSEKGDLRVAVIQSNIPQAEKWQGQSVERIQKKILDLTEESLKNKPQIVFWPETSFPGYPWQEPKRFEAIQEFVKKHHIHLLLGAVTRREGNYFNSAILLSPDGKIAGQYDKSHLVPFGEFLPLRPLLNFIENFVPIGDFGRGKTPTVFDGGFAVAICFEDTVAPVVRSLTKAGAKYLVNISNDAWFKDTNEPYLHLQSATFQSVANRRMMVRSANTGVSSQIFATGAMNILKNAQGKSVMIEGHKQFLIGAQDLRTELTFYTRFGDLFSYLCLFVVAGALIKRKYSL
ncbi:MAG: apolipoprotein N-acyltransferase [Candidatus Omnitrophica bacterium]|nr:apolipoprotein N-acyltransferase [Candidatus Omnitrophota bacterium]